MDMNRLMQQAQQAAQQMQSAQAELAEETVEGSAGGGMVTVQMSGARDIQSIKISPDVVDPDDVEMLEDLIVAALQDASAKAEELTQSKLGNLGMGGLNIPGLT
ncbi:MAG: YbaB/EbfC family nucleoid-associated protein [Thermomicrobiales bacterium]